MSLVRTFWLFYRTRTSVPLTRSQLGTTLLSYVLPKESRVERETAVGRAQIPSSGRFVKLRRLANLGLLAKDKASRSGMRRYYRISDPAKLTEFLNGCLDVAPLM